MPGYPAVSLSLLAARLGAGNRLIGLIVAAVTGCVLLLGELVLNLVPTPLLGSLLVWIGAAVTYEWLVLTARRLALWEYLTVVLIFLVIVGVSFTTGILVGLVAAIILFVVEYATRRQRPPRAHRGELSKHLRDVGGAPPRRCAGSARRSSSSGCTASSFSARPTGCARRSRIA